LVKVGHALPTSSPRPTLPHPLVAAQCSAISVSISEPPYAMSPFRVVLISIHYHLFHQIGYPYPFQHADQKSQSAVSISRQPDPFYYGHEHILCLCAKFLTHLLTCPELPPSSLGSTVKLPYFIAYALHCSKLHPSLTFAALQLPKAHFPASWGSLGHCLFVSVFM